jgi:hypothetical protein
MARVDHDNMTTGGREDPMSGERMLLLRHRVATGYYEQPKVIDATARAMLSSFGRGDHSAERSVGIHRIPSHTRAFG